MELPEVDTMQGAPIYAQRGTELLFRIYKKDEKGEPKFSHVSLIGLRAGYERLQKIIDRAEGWLPSMLGTNIYTYFTEVTRDPRDVACVISLATGAIDFMVAVPPSKDPPSP